MKVLVALEGFVLGQAALEAVALRIWPEDTVIKLVTVVHGIETLAGLLDSTLAQLVFHDDSPNIQVARQYLAAVSLELSSKVKGASVEWEVVVGNVRDALLRYSEEWPADLIVVGSHGKQGLGLLEAYPESLLQHSHCPVQIAKWGSTNSAFCGDVINILVAVDHSPYADAAVDWLTNQHWCRPVNFELVTILPPMPDCFTNEPDPEKAQRCLVEFEYVRASALQMLKAHADRLTARPERSVAHCEVFDGNPKDVILDLAEKWPADLIVMGSHGRTGLTKYLLGSVSQAVSVHAHCSTEVVRHRELIEQSPPSAPFELPEQEERRPDHIPHLGGIM